MRYQFAIKVICKVIIITDDFNISNDNNSTNMLYKKFGNVYVKVELFVYTLEKFYIINKTLVCL